MRGLINKFFKHDKAVLLILFAIFIFGVKSYINLPKESNPDIEIPILYIPLFLQGISPEDSEKLLIKPLERKLKSVSGVDEMQGYAYEGGGYVMLKFLTGTNIKTSISDVRAKIDEAKPEMPQNLTDITVREVNLSLFPVLNVILSGELNDRTLKTIAQNLKDKIESIPEVLSVDVNGTRDEVIEINISQKTLDNYKLNFDSISQTISRNNFLIQAGALSTQTGIFSIKVPGILNNIEEIRNIPIRVENGNLLRMRDIAEIRETYKDFRTVARMNGKKAVVLEISKRMGTNILSVIEDVKKTIEFEKQYIPNGIEITYSQDTSETIRDMIRDLMNTIILAIIIVFFIIFSQLGLRSALLVSIATPGSFFVGIIFISLMHLTINMVVLFSLVLAIGMLVDAAIVIVEYADRQMIGGVDRREAFREASTHMFWPSVAASITTKVVFLPLLFWPGTTGEFMKYLPLTLVSTLLGSLFMALVFIPVVGSYLGKPKKLSEKEKQHIDAIESGDFEKLTGMSKQYSRILDKALSMPKLTVIGVIGLLIAIIVLFSVFNVGIEFFPDVEPDNATVDIRARGNLSIQEKNTIMKEVESKILDMSNEVAVFYTKVGSSGRSSINNDAIGRISLEFANWKKRRKANVILNDIKDRMQKIPGIIVRTDKEQKGPSGGKAVQIELSSRNTSLLEKSVDKLIGYMNEVGGFTDIDDGKALPMFDFELVIDREKAALNKVDIASLNSLIPLITDGVLVGKFRGDKYDEEIDINIRFDKEERNLSRLDGLKISTTNGMIPITNFIQIRPIKKVASLYRNNGVRVRAVASNIAPGLIANNLTKALLEKVKNDKEWDPSVIIGLKGQEKDMRETQKFLGTAFLMAIMGMTVALVTQFNSLFMAILILTAVFFSFIGVLLALLVTMKPFGIVMCGVGVITLAGIVVNNNILLIDAYFSLLNRGVERFKAIEQAAISRLRPIILTSVTTAIGLLPMILSLNIDFLKFSIDIGAPSSQFWTQLSTAIAGGVLFATILTLFFTPAVLTLHARFIIKHEKQK